MKASLMTNLGLDDRTASQAIAGLPSNVLSDIISFVVQYGPYARGAVLAALPFLMKGDTFGAARAMIVYLLQYIPDSGHLQAAFPPAPIPTAESEAKLALAVAEANLRNEQAKLSGYPAGHPSRLSADLQDKVSRGLTLTKHEQALVDASRTGPSSGYPLSLSADIQDKINRGVALTRDEQDRVDASRRSPPSHGGYPSNFTQDAIDRANRGLPLTKDEQDALNAHRGAGQSLTKEEQDRLDAQRGYPSTTPDQDRDAEARRQADAAEARRRSKR